MGSGEEDDGAEEAQEDSSPIELDWACTGTKRTNEHTHIHTQKKEEDHAASLLQPPQRGRGEAPVCVFRAVLFPKKIPLSPSSLKSEQVSSRQKNTPLSTAGIDCAKLQTLPVLNNCKIILFYFNH